MFLRWHFNRAIGTFEWVVMPFGLKNARAIYQRARNSIFHNMIGRFMEVYIDDVVIREHGKPTRQIAM